MHDQPEPTNLNRREGWRPVALTLAAALLLVAALTVVAIKLQRPTAVSSKVQVVAAENFWGNIAAQIGGNHVAVTSIIASPNADPHLYESDPRDAAAVSDAGVVVENGAGYDDFMSKLLNAAARSGRRVVNAAAAVHAGGKDPNPHLWYSIPDVKAVAASIEAALAAQDPAHRSDYQANLQRFNSSLAPILQAEQAIRLRYGGADVAYTERVPAYMLDAAGLTVVTPPGFASAIEDGNEPSANDTTAMDTLMTNKQVRALLYNAQTTSPVTAQVKTLAERHGVPVVGVTETLPAGERSYQSWQLDQLRALQQALGS